jgi:hypothetical protein
MSAETSFPFIWLTTTSSWGSHASGFRTPSPPYPSSTSTGEGKGLTFPSLGKLENKSVKIKRSRVLNPSPSRLRYQQVAPCCACKFKPYYDSFILLRSVLVGRPPSVIRLRVQQRGSQASGERSVGLMTFIGRLRGLGQNRQAGSEGAQACTRETIVPICHSLSRPG